MFVGTTSTRKIVYFWRFKTISDGRLPHSGIENLPVVCLPCLSLSRGTRLSCFATTYVGSFDVRINTSTVPNPSFAPCYDTTITSPRPVP
nr:T3B protein - rabbit fibroma virus [Rabbit fibroma virus]